jgi:hypothetical protein
MTPIDDSDDRPRPEVDPGTAEGARPTLLEAAVRAGVQASEIGAYVATLLKVHADRAHWRARRFVVRICIAALVFVGLAAAIATAGVRLVSGACQILGGPLEGTAGSGDVAGGALALFAITLGIAAAVTLHSRRELRRREAEYDELHRKHIERYGTGEVPTPSQE